MLEQFITKRVARCLSQNSTLIIGRYSHSRKTHYDTLNLKPNCTNDEIRHAFAKLSKLHHPDTSKTGSVEQNAKKFQDIMEAYRILNKKTSRDAYDADLSSSSRFNANESGYYGQPFRYGDYEMMRRYRAGSQYYNPYSYGRNNTYGPNPYGPNPYGPNPYGPNPYGPNPFGKENFAEWSPMLNRRRVFGFIFGFILFNCLSVYLIYITSTHNRVAMKDFQSQYSGRRYGVHGLRYGMPEPARNDQYMAVLDDPK